MKKIIRKTRKQKTTANAVVFIDLTIFNFSYNTINGKHCCKYVTNEGEVKEQTTLFQYRKR